MRRLLPLLVLGFALAGVGAPHAFALSEPQSTLLRSLSQSELKALIADIDAQGLNSSGTSNVKTGVGRMQLAAGRFGTLGALSTIGVAATGSVIVWKIADGLGLGGYVYRKITGEAYGGDLANVTNPRWIVFESTGSIGTHTMVTDDWYFNAGTSLAYEFCGTLSGCTNSFTGMVNASTLALALSGSFDTTGNSYSGVPSPSILHRSPAQMQNAIRVEPSDAAEFASPPGGATTVTAGTADPTTLTDPELEAALDAIDPNPGTAGTAVEQDTAEAILDELEPGWAQGILLQPLPNETYTQYITRLQEAGWVGDATSTELATETPGYGPEAVVRVIATPSGGTTTVYDPLNWPSPGPTIDIDSDITIRYNPDTAPEAPTTATPTTITVPPTTIPGAPAVDFSPITELDPGCKFPYGFICYAVDFTEQFDVSPDAPVFTFTLGWTGIVNGQEEGGEAPYTVDLEVMDDYMALWRGILTVVLWVGAIFLVATRMLGVKFGGDPGEAIDDVL